MIFWLLALSFWQLAFGLYYFFVLIFKFILALMVAASSDSQNKGFARRFLTIGDIANSRK
jgi:hypothetical protein